MKTHSLVMAAAGATASDTLYVEDVFSTYLYTGNGSTQTINNGIDLASKGGLVWSKYRVAGPSSYWDNHWLIDTKRGGNNYLHSNLTSGQNGAGSLGSMISFGSSGYTLPSGNLNYAGSNLVSWTFRKDPKFFDVVTYTGTGAIIREIPHSLSSHPGFIIIKRTDLTSDWIAIARDSSGTYKELRLNTNGAAIQTYASYYLASVGAQNYFHVGTNAIIGDSNVSGATYVAYLFAHNAGGFGLSGTDNAISCGSYTGNGLTSGPVVTLGYEPQWVLVKRTDATVATGYWQIQDNMRSLSQTNTNILFPNLSNAATTGAYPSVVPTATGFYIGDGGTGYNASGGNYIYIAIRRPNKPPTIGTSVFSPVTFTAGSSVTVTSGFPVDLFLSRRNNLNSEFGVVDRLRGGNVSGPQKMLFTGSVYGEVSNTYSSNGFGLDSNTVVIDNFTSYAWGSGSSIGEAFRRAPGFFDVVCYRGVGTSGYRAIPHNLTVVPEFIIVKNRTTNVGGWVVGSSYFAGGFAGNNYLLNTSGATFGGGYLGGGPGYNPTATNFYVEGYGNTNDTDTANVDYVAYLFATCPGVSKVGSYTGNGSSQTINCGFTTGARFVLIKRTDNTGDWYVWDSARGIVSANDPHLSLNTGVAEVTTDDSVDPDNSGFIVNQVAATNINVSSATYIYLAIA